MTCIYCEGSGKRGYSDGKQVFKNVYECSHCKGTGKKQLVEISQKKVDMGLAWRGIMRYVFKP